ncbi:MAG: porin [Ignavibacteria bacterium]
MKKRPLSFPELFIAITLTCCFCKLNAQGAKYDGFIELGGDIEYNDLYIESFYKAKLEFKIKLNEKTKVELDIRAESDEQQIELREASVDYDLSKTFRISAGALKKRFGREELVSREKLHTIQRSMINRYLSPLGYVSRDPGIHLRWKDELHELITGFNYNEAHSLTFMSRYSVENIWIFDDIGGGLHFVKHLNRQGINNSYAMSLDFARKFGKLNSDLEFFYGMDPVETGYRKIAGIEDDVNFFGAKIQTAYKFKFDNEILTGLEPLLILGYIAPDTELMDVNKLELLIGFNVYIDKHIRFMINGDLILTNNKLNKSERSYNESNAIAQFQISW